MESQKVLIAFGLTALAGLSTGLGSDLAFFAKRTNTKLRSVALGFSAGVMIYVSSVELFSNAKDSFVDELGRVTGYWITVLAFFGGIAIAVAIAIHNTPEGVAASIPIYYATGSRRRAFVYSFFSGVAEPVGALIGYAILFAFLNNVVFGVLFASVAGIMVFISLDELLPTAGEYGEHHLSAYGLVAGMMVMALSLLLFVR